MIRTFVMVHGFERKWQDCGLDDDGLLELHTSLLLNPIDGEVIVGTHGVRKMRWALPGKGKSGGIRIFYVDFPHFGILYLLTLLQKNEASNLDKNDRNALGELVQSIERALKKNPKFGEKK